MKSRIGILLISLFSILCALGQENITAMEYYIDTDPGIGNGTTIAITSGTPQDVDFTIGTTGLSIGFHFLVVRAQDASGDWGIQQSRPFYVSTSSTSSTASVTEFEYFFDMDPGVGNGTSIVLTPSTTIDLDDMLSTASLSDGFHELFVRALDDDGTWGIQKSRAFFLSSASTASPTSISQIEYFFDTDPGVGNGTAVTLTPAGTIDVQEMIATSTLSDGFHELFVRAQDDRGVWGIKKSRPFFIDNMSQSSASEIAGVEYFIDTDPGFGAGTQVSVSPSEPSIDLDLTVSTSSLPNGNYVLGMRVVDTNGDYSITENASFTICTGATTDFSATTVCAGSVTDFSDLSTGVDAGATYSWDFDNNGSVDDTTIGNTSFTYPSEGTYTAVLTIDQLSCPATREITVVVEAIPTANAGIDQTVAGDAATLAATAPGAGETGVWTVESGSATFSDSNSPSASVTGLASGANVLRWTVTSDNAGCSDFDEVTITATDALSEETDILSLDLVNVTETVVVDAAAHTVDVEVPTGTTLTSLEPTITISPGATISPTGPQDFSNPVVYTVTAENGSTMQDWTVTIEPSDQPLGFGDDAQIQVYPNPTHNKLFISGIVGNYTVSMIDLTGKRTNFNENVQEVQLDNFSEGIYTLIIDVIGGESHTLRILKKN